MIHPLAKSISKKIQVVQYADDIALWLDELLNQTKYTVSIPAEYPKVTNFN